MEDTAAKNTRTADMAMTTAKKALKVADRALKGGGAPAAAPAPVEEMIVHQGPIEGGPSTEQIMEHVRVRVIDLVNEHIGDKFATDRRLEEAMRAVDTMPAIQEDLREVRSLCLEVRTPESNHPNPTSLALTPLSRPIWIFGGDRAAAGAP